MRLKQFRLDAFPLIASIGVLVFTALSASAQTGSRPAGWSEPTHGDDAAPDYARLFATDRVHEIRIRMAAEDYAAMQTDLETIRGGPFRVAGGRPMQQIVTQVSEFVVDMRERVTESTEACANREPEAACTIDGRPGRCLDGPAAIGLVCQPELTSDNFVAVSPGVVRVPPPTPPPATEPPAFPPPGLQPSQAPPPSRTFGAVAPVMTSRDPIYVPVTVSYDGNTWTGVGMRYKGNSSLSAVSMGRSAKVPFRLDFDRYEDEDPGIRNQRFYGFHKLTFASNFSDESMLKEVLATEAFRDQGVPASRAAFYRVFVDVGNGDEYWGLYTMVEDPADGAMLDAQFGNSDGNLYKPNGPGANWTGFDPSGFEKKTNEKAEDWSDVAAAISALHAPQTDAAAWRSALEAQFDVDGFLRWLAVNTLIGNWDSYGRMAHNYYLYGDPADGGRLHWIPWDHNMSFAAATVGRAGGPFGATAGPFGMTSGDMLHSQAGNSWPLISRLMDDPVYSARYRELLEAALDGLTSPERFEPRVRELHALIAPYVVGPEGEKAPRTTLSSATGFDRSADVLIAQARALHEQARNALMAREELRAAQQD